MIELIVLNAVLAVALGHLLFLWRLCEYTPIARTPNERTHIKWMIGRSVAIMLATGGLALYLYIPDYRHSLLLTSPIYLSLAWILNELFLISDFEYSRLKYDLE